MLNLVATLPYWQFGPWPKEPWDLYIFDFQIHAFGIAVAVGLLLGISWMARRAERKLGLENELVQNFGIFLLIIGWPLSHVFNVIFYEPHLLVEDPLELFRFWGSISSYGGLFGGLLAFLIWSHRHPRVDRATWAEIGATGIVIPWFFGRIGCALVHDHPGALAPDFPLALEFPGSARLPGGPRYDLGFLEAIWWGVILAAMLILDRKPRRKGFYLAFLPLVYAPVRFGLDFLRVPQDLGGDIRYAGLTPAQYFSIALFLLGLVMVFRMRNNPVVEWAPYRPDVPPPPTQTGTQRASKTRAAPSPPEAASDPAPAAKTEPEPTTSA